MLTLKRWLGLATVHHLGHFRMYQTSGYKIFSGSENKRVAAIHMFKDQSSQVGKIMALLIKVPSAWFVEGLASDVLFVLC